MATRQNSSSGKPKSPRIQVVLPEGLCARLSALAKQESRTVSNMAKVIIQQSIQSYEERYNSLDLQSTNASTETFRSALEAQEPKRLRGAPRRLRFYKPT